MVNVQSPPKLPPPTGLPPRPRYSRKLVAALVLIIVVALVAIGVLLSVDDNGSSNSSPPSSVPVLSTPPTVDPEAATKAAILEAHRLATEAFVAVGSDPNGKPDDPRLEEHKVGAALLAAQASIDRLRRAGQAFRGDVEVHPTVVELGPETATVEDCALDRVSTVDLDTGEVVEPAVTEASSARVTFKLINGTWKQNTFTDLKRACTPSA